MTIQCWSLQVSLVTSVCGLWLLFPAIEHTVLVWTNYIILSLFTHSSLHMAMDEVNATSWPDGPSNLNDLFLWPHYNCCCLLNHPDVGDQCTANALWHLYQWLLQWDWLRVYLFMVATWWVETYQISIQTWCHRWVVHPLGNKWHIGSA